MNKDLKLFIKLKIKLFKLSCKYHFFNFLHFYPINYYFKYFNLNVNYYYLKNNFLLDLRKDNYNYNFYL